MADTNSKLNELITQLTQLKTQVKEGEKGAKDFDNALARLGGLNTAVNKIQELNTAILQLSNAQNRLAASGNVTILPGLTAALADVKALKAELALLPINTYAAGSVQAQTRFISKAQRAYGIQTPESTGEQRLAVAQQQWADAQSKGLSRFTDYQAMLSAKAKEVATNLATQELATKQAAKEAKATAEAEAQKAAINKAQVGLLEQEIAARRTALNFARNRFATSPESARIQTEGTQEFSSMQTAMVQERIRAEAVTRAQAEADAARTRLQGAGTKSVFGSVLGGTNVAELEKFNGLLAKYGMSAEHITGISKDLSTGVSQISYSMKDANGVIQQGTIHVDRFGRMLADSSGRFKSFGDMIARNVTKVLEWAVAIGVVYGGIQKITQLVDSMKKMQDVWVNIGIITQQDDKYMESMFNQVKQIADITATDFASGIESLAVALRATSGIADQGQRSAAAMTLLKDAMTLAKLAGIEHAQAMDYLVAGLRQMDMQLTNGTILLDKFQAISQRSNTSLEDLASTFATTAGSAQDVGVTVDELTGLIGAFSEATTLGARETGNALRAMFSNFTQPQAIETLNKYGIAVKDLNGEFRSFTDVFKQVSELARSGILSDRQVAELANAIGGGARRQAQVTALLTVQPRAEALTNISATQASGAAQEALSKKTETLSSAIERLQNAFDGLAKNLGTGGGFLDVLTAGVDLLSKLIGIIDGVTKVLGPATSALIAFGLAMVIKRSYGPNILEALGGFGIGGTKTGGLTGAAQQQSQLAAQGIQTSINWSNIGRQFAGAAVPVLMMGFSQFASGNTASGIGTVIGGGLLAILTGNPLWGIIGATIGSAFATSIETFVNQVQASAKAQETIPTGITGNETIEGINQKIHDLQQQFLDLSATSVDPFARLSSALGGTPLSELLKSATQGGEKFGFSNENIAKAKLILSLVEEINKVANKKTELGTVLNPDYQGIKSFQDAMKQYDIQFNRKQQFGLIQQLGAGEIGKGEYKDLSQIAAPGSSMAATQIIIALNPQLKNATQQGIQPFIEKWKELKTLMATTGPEDRAFITDVVTSISQANTNIDELTDRITKAKDFLASGAQLGFGSPEFANNVKASLDAANLQGLITQLANAKDVSAQLKAELDAVIQAIKAANDAQFKFQGFQDFTKLKPGQFEQYVKEAQNLQASYAYQSKGTIDLEKLKQNAAEWIAFLPGGYFEPQKGLEQEFLNWVIQAHAQAEQDMQNSFNFQNLRNIDASMRGRLQQAINYYTQLLRKYGMNEKNELITVLFKDNQVGQLIGSQTALQLALQDLTDVTKKQLDGVYNLPAGATAYIPLSAGQMLSNYTANQGAGSNIDYGNFPTPVIEKGNTILADIDRGIQQVVNLLGKPFDQTKQIEEVKAGLSTGQYKSIMEGLEATSIFKNAMAGPPAPTTTLIPTKPESMEDYYQRHAKEITQPTNVLMKLIPSIFDMITKPLQMLTTPQLTPVSQNINIKPAKVEASFANTTVLRLDGRILWNEMKKYAFNDWLAFTSSVGSSDRSRTNVL